MIGISASNYNPNAYLGVGAVSKSIGWHARDGDIYNEGQYGYHRQFKVGLV